MAPDPLGRAAAALRLWTMVHAGALTGATGFVIGPGLVTVCGWTHYVNS